MEMYTKYERTEEGRQGTLIPASKEEEQAQELLSDEVQEVISIRPHWIVRKVNTIFLLILLLLLSLTWIIQYPDIIYATAELVSADPPKLVKARTEGKITRLFIENEQEVEKDQHLGCIENTADYNAVMQLRNWVLRAVLISGGKEYDQQTLAMFPALNNLGELQAPYQQFQAQLAVNGHALAKRYYQQKQNGLQKDLQYLASLKKNAAQQWQLQREDQQMQKKEYDAYEKLANDKVIAPLELNQYKSRLINKEQGLEQLAAQITNTEISSQLKQKEILELQKQLTDQELQFHSSLLELKNEVEKWIQKYVLLAPAQGRVLLASALRENEWINEGQVLFHIQPRQSSVYVEIMAGQKGLGKVAEGQRVLLKVEGYPSNEYGYLQARVSHIATISNQRDSFLLKAILVKGLQTNYGRPVFFRNGLSAQAEIITRDRRLIDRIMGQLKELMSR